MESLHNTSIKSPEYRSVPISQLIESPTNPRKRYDQAGLEELAGSIRAHGILEPLVVRTAGEQFEIIAGSRRFRGAKIAGAEAVPARIVELNDAEAREVQLIENLQREDIHPLEEAHGFRDLLNLPDQQYTIARIAERAGKSAAYVAGRLKLTDLIPDVAEASLADKLTIGHALLIAKLPPSQQHEALKAAFKPTWVGSNQTEILIPARELAGWIESNLLLDLKTAPFDRADATLVAEAGSCHDCTKRTGANSLLFPEAQQDSCPDGSCWKIKVAAHLAQSVEENPNLIQISENWKSNGDGVLSRGQYVEIQSKAGRNGHGKLSPERKKCGHIAKAIVVDGGHVGHVVQVCADPSCDTHHADARKATEAHERMRAENRKQEEQRKLQLATRTRILEAILEKVTAPLAVADLELIAREVPGRIPHEYRTVLAQRHSPVSANGNQAKKPIEIGSTLKNLDETGYSRLLIEAALTEATYSSYSRDGAERLNAVARRHRVNAQKLAESVSAEFAERRKRRDGKKVPAQKPLVRDSNKRRR